MMMNMMRIPFLRNVTVIFSQNLTDIFNVFFITYIHTTTQKQNQQQHSHVWQSKHSQKIIQKQKKKKKKV